jgi:Lysylphosphatidylglycerol synthase TM region
MRSVIALLAAAVALHVCGQVARGMAWRGVLAATWPAVTRRRAVAWHVCGAGFTGALSARGGDAVRIALAKRELDGATWPALAGTLCAEGSFEAVCGLVIALVTVWLGIDTLAGPSPLVLGAAAAALAVAGLLAVRYARARRIAREVGRGLAVLREPGRWLRQVLPWQVCARLLRLCSVACFLLAFGLPAAPAVIVAACAAQGSGAMVPLPGGGPAAMGGALLVALPIAAGHPIDPDAVAALAVVWPVALTVVGVTISLSLLNWLTGGLRGLRELLRIVQAHRLAGRQPHDLAEVLQQ